MRITLTDHDREKLAAWLSDLAYARMQRANTLDAISVAESAGVHVDTKRGLTYAARVFVLDAAGVRDVTVRVWQDRVEITPTTTREAATTLPDTA